MHHVFITFSHLPHALLLNSGQTSRLVSCGFTFGSQYTHLIHSQTFFILLPRPLFCPFLFLGNPWSKQNLFYLLLPPFPLSLFFAFQFYAFHLKSLSSSFDCLLVAHSAEQRLPSSASLISVRPTISCQKTCCQVDLWGSQTEHFLPPQLNSLMLVTVTTGKLSRVITPGPRRRSHSPLFNPLSPCSSFLCESWHWQSWYWSTSSSSSPWWWQQGKWWEGARRWRGLGPPGHDLRINTAHRHQMQHSITMHSITLQCNTNQQMHWNAAPCWHLCQFVSLKSVHIRNRVNCVQLAVQCTH